MTLLSAVAIVCVMITVSCSDTELATRKPPLTMNAVDSKKEAIPTTLKACTKYPLVFLHGFLGGNRIGTFSGAKNLFESKGCKVLMAEVSPVNGVEVRANQLKDQIEKFLTGENLEKVNIIAHSQGGLDARYAISKLDLAKRVASLSMLSTPNLGTPVADLAKFATSDALSKTMISNLLSIMVGTSSSQNLNMNDAASALASLSTRYVNEQFNPNTPDVAGVYY